jgi:26S proteasome non-ATPase regulatory subunit 10
MLLKSLNSPRSDQLSLLRSLLDQDPKSINSIDAVCLLTICSLFSNEQKDGRTALHWAASTGSNDIARFLIDQNAEVDKPDGSGWTPLHIAGSSLNSV